MHPDFCGRVGTKMGWGWKQKAPFPKFPFPSSLREESCNLLFATLRLPNLKICQKGCSWKAHSLTTCFRILPLFLVSFIYFYLHILTPVPFSWLPLIQLPTSPSVNICFSWTSYRKLLEWVICLAFVAHCCKTVREDLRILVYQLWSSSSNFCATFSFSEAFSML